MALGVSSVEGGEIVETSAGLGGALERREEVVVAAGDGQSDGKELEGEVGRVAFVGDPAHGRGGSGRQAGADLGEVGTGGVDCAGDEERL